MPNTIDALRDRSVLAVMYGEGWYADVGGGANVGAEADTTAHRAGLPPSGSLPVRSMGAPR